MESTSQTPRYSGFVAETIKRCSADNAYRAAMRRADNPDTAAMAWEYLVSWCDISKEYERLPFALIGAAIAREKTAANGTKNLGELFRACCKDENDTEREKRRFRRIISCDSVAELCEVLRSTLMYFQGTVPGEIDYESLLKDILFFGERVKLKWAGSFFGHRKENEEGTDNVSDKNLS